MNSIGSEERMLSSGVQWGKRRSDRLKSTHQCLRKRDATFWISGRLSRFLFQQSSITFHAPDERPNFEASAGLEGRLPFAIMSWTLRSESSGKGSFPVKI